MIAAAQSAPARTHHFNRLLRRLSTTAPPDCHACDVPRAIPQSAGVSALSPRPCKPVARGAWCSGTGGDDYDLADQADLPCRQWRRESRLDQMQGVLITAWRSPNTSDIVGAIKSPGKTT